MEQLEARVLDLEEYQPVINERLANNELAIEALEEKMLKTVNSPAGDLQEVLDEVKKLALA